ncbi:MAG: fibronectin/fibrinogen-binding protein [Ruminococcaceae bacterium]|nr:fibronectin/fibrinogen-binding protein [Oscillospiraceae bacterium]
MPLDATAIACMTHELRIRLQDGRIDKVYQPERDEITLSVRTLRETVRLAVSAGHTNPRLHITEVRKKNPADAPMFCMLLRKHLAGGKITDITQPDFERILRFTVRTHNELGDLTERFLYAEFTGRNPNIILTDENGKIIDAAHHTDLSSGRTILPGMTYTPPPLQEKENPLLADAERCTALLETMPQALAEKALVTLFRGISPMAARCIAAESCGREDVQVEGNISALAAGIVRFFDRVKQGEFSPSLLITPEGIPADFTAYAPFACRDVLTVEKAESLSAVMDAFYTRRDQSDRMRQKGASLKKRAVSLLERTRKKISIHEATLADTANMEQYRIYGELLCANLYRVRPGDTEVTLENFYNNMEPIRIPLDKTKGASANAQLYFKKYRKLKTAAVVVQEELVRAKEEAAYMETVVDAISRAEDEDALAEIRRELSSGGYIKEEIRGKKQKDVPAAPLRFTLGDFSVLVGRNNRQNDQVTLRLSRAEDIWLHTKNIPGSHVLIQAMHREVPEEVIRRAAEIAAWYSAGQRSAQVPVDFTAVKNVWKPSGAKPGMVLYEKQHTVYVTPVCPEIDSKRE